MGAISFQLGSVLLLLVLAIESATQRSVVAAFVPNAAFSVRSKGLSSADNNGGGLLWTQLYSSSPEFGKPTELPDSLEDAAEIAATACAKYVEAAGPGQRCRVDFDTSVGDETFTLLKTSTEFMQNFVSFLSYALIPGAQQTRQDEMMRLVQAQADLKRLMEDMQNIDITEEEMIRSQQEKMDELENIIRRQGRESEGWEGPIARVYFPDEGNAALANRDWKDKVPPCVKFASCGGVQMADISQDQLVFFFCPKASEAESVERLLNKFLSDAPDVQLVVFVNPYLVDMGVTGFGMAGRLLRERLIDTLQNMYYLRTLPWGALTRVWPSEFSVWQEDENVEGGYRLIKSMDTLPSNPEVEDIYDIENGNMQEKRSGGPLDQFGDFVNGMMRL